MQAGSAAVLLVLVGWCWGQAAPPTSCVDVLKYEPIDGERDRRHDGISLSVLDRKAESLRSWVGDVATSDKVKFQIEQIKKKSNLTSATDIRFHVKYNPYLTEVKLNGRKVSDVKIPQMTSDRLIREKREFSWISLIGSHESRPSSPSEQVNIKPDSSRWLTFVSKPQPALPNPQPVSPAYKSNSHVETKHFNLENPDPNNWLTFIAPGKQPVLPAPKPNHPADQGVCGRVNKHSPLLINGKPTLAGQWPWQVALYRRQSFSCGGTLVSRQHVVTAAHCVTLKESEKLVNKDTLFVYLGKHNLRTSTEGVQTQSVANIIVHPQYNALSNAQDLGILKLQGSVQFTDFVQPACLWPEDEAGLSNIIGKIGIVVGWGVNEKRVATEELGLVEMPVVSQNTCRRVNHGYDPNTYCAGFRDDTTACYGDSGSGMVLKIQDTWHIRGLVSLTINDCDPSHYIIFTDLAKFLPWIKANIQSEN